MMSFKEAMVRAGEMMSSKEYSEGSPDHPDYAEIQARWQAVFAQLQKEKDEQTNSRAG